MLSTDALPLGIDALRLELSGLEQPARQIGLWPGPGELDAVREVLERYPAALVRAEWRDPYAYAADAQYVWVDWLTGAERPGRLRPGKPEAMSDSAPTPAPVPAVPMAAEAVPVRQGR